VPFKDLLNTRCKIFLCLSKVFKMHYDTGRMKVLFLLPVKIQGDFLIAFTLLNTNMTKSNCPLTYLFKGEGIR